MAAGRKKKAVAELMLALAYGASHENAAQKEADALRGKPTVIWFWRHTHDTSPDKIEARLEKELSQNRTVRQYDYLPYSQPERWILCILRGPGQPGYFYRLTEMR